MPGRAPKPKALLVRAGALGDVLLLRRAVAALRRAGYDVALIAPTGAGAALVGAGLSEVQRLVPWERADLAGLLAEAGSLPASLQQDLASHDLAVVYSRNEPLARSLRALVPAVLAQDPTPPPDVHVARWLAAPLEGRGLDIASDPPPCAASVNEEELAGPWCERLPPGFLAVHPGSGSPRKSWPPHRFLELLQELRPPKPWLVVCGPADAAAVAPLRARAETLVAEGLPLRLLGAVLARAGLFVGNDSGVSHLAAAWGAPTVALFGPTDARTWAPEGPRVRTLQAPTGRMERITVGEVLAMARAASAPWS